MNQETFNKLISEIHAQCSEIMLKKRSDYANEDVLSNFKRLSELAKLLNIDPRNSPADYALFMVAMKIDRWCNLRKQGKQPENESIMDTVIDLHNYIDLAYACEVDE